MEKYLIFFILFILPFVVFPIGSSAYEPVKVVGFQIILAIICIHAIFTKKINISQLPKQLIVPIGLIFLLILFHLYQYPTQLTWWGNSFRMQGALTLVALVLWAIIVAHLPNTMPIKPKIIILILVLLSLSALLSVKNSDGRSIGTFGEPNALAAYTIFIWPLALVINQNKSFNKSNMLALTITALIIYLTVSKSAVIALVVQILFLIAITSLPKYYKGIVIVAVIIALLTHTLTFIEPSKIWESRKEVWTTAFISGFYQPILGNGVGNMETVFMMSAGELRNTIRYQYVDSSHNIFLDWWVQFGISGLALFVYLLGSTIKNLARHHNTIYLTAFIGTIIVMQFNPTSIIVLVGLWWIIGSAHRQDYVKLSISGFE